MKSQPKTMCPTCGRSLFVIDSRQVDGMIRRRRRCDNDHRFTTYEAFVEEGSRKFPHKFREMLGEFASPPSISLLDRLREVVDEYSKQESRSEMIEPHDDSQEAA